MGEQKRFDPVDWFVSAAFAVLVGAVVLTIAVRLLEAIWLWLVLGAVLASLLVGGVRLVLWWQRGRSW